MAGPATQPQADSSDIDAETLSGPQVSAIDYLVQCTAVAPNQDVCGSERTCFTNMPTIASARYGAARALSDGCCTGPVPGRAPASEKGPPLLIVSGSAVPG